MDFSVFPTVVPGVLVSCVFSPVFEVVSKAAFPGDFSWLAWDVPSGVGVLSAWPLDVFSWLDVEASGDFVSSGFFVGVLCRASFWNFKVVQPFPCKTHVSLFLDTKSILLNTLLKIVTISSLFGSLPFFS